MRAQLLAGWVVLALGAVGIAGAAPAATTKDVDDGDAWLAAHGSKDPEKRLQNACCCVEVSVGRPAERALDCKEEQAGGHAKSADIAITEVIRVVRGGKVVKVLQAWVGLDNLDKPHGARPWLELRLTVDRSGRTVTIADPGGTLYACKRGGKSSSDDDGFDVWVDRVCASRGTYRWRGGRFVRAAK